MKTRIFLLLVFALIRFGDVMAQDRQDILKGRKRNCFNICKIYTRHGKINVSSDVWLTCFMDQSEKNYYAFNVVVIHRLNPGPGTPQYFWCNDTTFMKTIPVTGKARLQYTTTFKNIERQHYSDDNILADKGLYPVYETTVKFNGKKKKEKALKAKVKLRFRELNKENN